jgi:hypothetical protein
MPIRILNYSVCAFAICAVAAFVGGCGKSETKKAPAEQSQTSVDSNQKQVASVQPQKDNQLPDAGATAAQVCERFMVLLQNGERTIAEELLTRKALTATGQLDLQLESMGSVDAKVKIGEPLYATSRAKVAQVPCSIKEKNGDQQELTWLMRRQDSGWRISGLIVESSNGPELLSLENLQDVAAIKRQTGQDELETESSQIRLTSAEEEVVE